MRFDGQERSNRKIWPLKTNVYVSFLISKHEMHIILILYKKKTYLSSFVGYKNGSCGVCITYKVKVKG